MVAHAGYSQDAPSSENAEKPPAKSAATIDKNFASRFPLYVYRLRIVTQYHWNLNDVNPSTHPGARAYVSFEISKNGDATHISVAKSSNSPTLDSSCVKAVQKSANYGPLPSDWDKSTLSVSYYCEMPVP
jgi:protein TonB